jgi:hypothetical protein
VLVHIGITSNKDLWKHLCVGYSCGESKSQVDTRRIFRMILRPRGPAEPAEVGVLCHKNPHGRNLVLS